MSDDDAAAEARRRIARAREVIESQRGSDVLRMRLDGLSYEQIGEALGITKQAAWQSVKRSLEAAAEERKGLASLQLDFELAQLDAVIAGMAEASAAGDARAGMTILKAMERRAKLLGLDAPEKHEVHGVNTDPQVTHARLGAIAARASLTPDPGAARDPHGDGAG